MQQHACAFVLSTIHLNCLYKVCEMTLFLKVAKICLTILYNFHSIEYSAFFVVSFSFKSLKSYSFCLKFTILIASFIKCDSTLMKAITKVAEVANLQLFKLLRKDSLPFANEFKTACYVL